MEMDAAVSGSGGWIRLICTDSFAKAKIPKKIQGPDMGTTQEFMYKWLGSWEDLGAGADLMIGKKFRLAIENCINVHKYVPITFLTHNLF